VPLKLSCKHEIDAVLEVSGPQGVAHKVFSGPALKQSGSPGPKV